jgi:hypothetical protein
MRAKRSPKRHIRKSIRARGLGVSATKSARGRKAAKQAKVERSGGAATATKRAAIAKRVKAHKKPSTPLAAPALARGIVEVKPPGVPVRTQYPLHALPATLRDFVETKAVLKQADQAAVAVPLIVGTMATIGNAVRCEVHPDWHEPLAAICAVLGISGDNKTAAVDTTSEILLRVEEQVAVHPHAIDIDGLRERCQLYTNDVSLAKLIELMSEQPRGLIFVRDELHALFAGASSAGGKALELKVLEATEGKRHRKNRIGATDDSKPVPPYVLMSIVGGMPRGIYRKVMAANGRLESGLAARFWTVCPPKRQRRHSIPATVLSDKSSGIEDRLLQILMRLRTISFDGIQWAPVKCTEEAAHRVTDFANEQEAIIFVLCDTSVEKSMRSKARGWVARVACMLALVRAAEQAEAIAADSPIDASKVEVTLEDVEAAIELITWQLDENVRALHDLGLEAPGNEIAKIDLTVGAALGKGKFPDSLTPYELAPALKTSHKMAEQMLEDLVAAGRWEAYYPPAPSGGGRPSKRYRRRTSAT